MRIRVMNPAAVAMASFAAWFCLTMPAAAQEGAAVKAVASSAPGTEVKPTPHLPDGHVDLGNASGVWAPKWVLDWSDKKYVDKQVDVPFTDWALKKFQERRATNSKDDPEGYCLPPGVPRYTGTPYPFQIVQIPGRIYIIYESMHGWRTVYMDGRQHPKDPDPTWLGNSIGHWEGDTLVVDTVGFNDRTWLDYVGHPHSDKLHVIEKFQRPNYNTLEYTATIIDPVAYTKPWTTSFKIPFKPGWDLLEYICNENNHDIHHMNTTEPH